MLNRKRKTKAPCSGCSLHLERCICNLINPIETKSRLTLIIHSKELKRTTNTGKLATQALTNSQVYVRGLKDSQTDLKNVLDPLYTPLFLFPTENAVPLTQEFINSIPRPIQLIVPDGNWRQAGKVFGRYSELTHVQAVTITKKNEAKHHLRKESSENGMATLEAIAEAFRVIESEASFLHLKSIYVAKLKNTLIGRGILHE